MAEKVLCTGVALVGHRTQKLQRCRIILALVGSNRILKRPGNSSPGHRGQDRGGEHHCTDCHCGLPGSAAQDEHQPRQTLMFVMSTDNSSVVFERARENRVEVAGFDLARKRRDETSPRLVASKSAA